MSLAIQTNVSALYAQGALRSNQSKLASTMERLSTGIRVNGAKDDAAGLAIGQNITSQIRGLDQAVRNINDGINLVQTAEAGLNSVSTMLQRMRELAVQAANGTYSDIQREYLNKECQQLKTAVGQVVDTTMWNDQKLLDGSFSKPIQIGSDVGAKMEITIPSASLIASTTNSTTTVSATQKTGGVVGSTALAAGDLTINSTPIGGAAASAKDVAAAINLQTGTTGVTATARATASTAAAYSTDYNITTVSPTQKAGGVVGSTALASGDLTINSTPIGGAAASAKDVAAAINLQSSTTGVTATARATVSTAATYSTDYNIDGTIAWTKLLGTSENDICNAITTGLDGSIYVSGMTEGALDGQTNSGSWDAFLTKYSTDGTKAWTKLLGSSGVEYVYGQTTGLDGSIYVSGYTTGALDGQTNSGGRDAYLTKYSADGTKAWTKLLGGSGDDEAYALTTGLDGSIYVSGYTYGALDGQTNSGGRDVELIKLSADGTREWARLLGSSSTDHVNALTTGLDGSVYVSGYTEGALDGQTNSGGRDAYLTKYSVDGTKAWTKLLGTSGLDRAYALTTGLDGSIYVSGYTEGALDGQTNSGLEDAYLTKYSADGTKAWTKLLGTSSNDRAFALTTGLDGSIYVSGHTYGALDGQTNSGLEDAYLTRYGADGTKAWTKLLGTSGIDRAFALTTGLDGSIYVSGQTSGALDGQANSGGLDAFLTKFSVLSGTIAADAIRINGTDIGAIGTASTAQQRSTQMAAAINAVSTSTGVSATANTSTGGVTLSAADGRNIEISTLSSAAITSNQTGIALSGSVSGDRTVTTFRSGIDLNSSSSAGITVTANALGSTATGLTSGTVAATINVSGASGAIAADAIRINGTDIGAIGTASTAQQRSTQMAAAINAVSTSTGVSASANTSTGGVTLSAADGRNIEISTLSSAAIASNQTGIALSGSVSGDRTVTTFRSGIDLNSTSATGIVVIASASGATATGLTSGTVTPTINTVTTITNTDRVTLDLSTVDKSSSSITAIDVIIDAVNNTRATLGSYINRLAYAADNVTNISSNSTQSRSTILDTDYAMETTNLAKNQIIQQAATAMLAQANTQPQAVMALLKNM